MSEEFYFEKRLNLCDGANNKWKYYKVNFVTLVSSNVCGPFGSCVSKCTASCQDRQADGEGRWDWWHVTDDSIQPQCLLKAVRRRWLFRFECFGSNVWRDPPMRMLRNWRNYSTQDLWKTLGTLPLSDFVQSTGNDRTRIMHRWDYEGEGSLDVDI